MSPEWNTPKQEQEPEKIKASALRFRGQVFTGHTHTDAMRELGESYPDWGNLPDRVEDGFITTTGRYVDRDEAGQIADRADQITQLGRTHGADEYLDSHHVKELKPNWIE